MTPPTNKPEPVSAAGTQMSQRPNQYTVGSLFAAIGGFAKAFQLVGAQPLWANEKDKFAAITFAHNFDTQQIRYLNKPIEELSVKGDALAPVDILTAGFPCQPFSIAGKLRGFGDDRGLLFLHIIRLLREFGPAKPKILLFENVSNLKRHDDGRTFKRIQIEIQKAGYWFSEANSKLMNTADYTEIPQNRDRIFMVAANCDYFSSNHFKFPVPLPKTHPRKTVRSFLDRDQKADCYYFEEGTKYYNLFAEAIKNGDEKAVFQLRRSYVRQNMTGSCFTLMANMGEGGHNQPVIKDQWGIRKLTPIECARLQGYSDDWFRTPGISLVSRAQLYKQIGNSVTIPLVTQLAKNLIAYLESNPSTSRTVKHAKVA